LIDSAKQLYIVLLDNNALHTLKKKKKIESKSKRDRKIERARGVVHDGNQRP